MSSSKLTHTEKRKHGEVADEMIRGLEEYGELTPKSQKLRDTLLKRAKVMQESEYADDGLLSSSYELFEAKQKQDKEQRELVAKHKDELEAERAITRDANDALEKFKSATAVGDWFLFVLRHVQSFESSAQNDDQRRLLGEIQRKNKALKDEAEDKAKAAAKAKGVPFRGPVYYEKLDSKEAANQSNWCALTGRTTTEVHEFTQKERAAVDDWLNSGAEETSAPETPFLDRIEHMCEKAERSRSTVLQWIDEYSARNELCHKPPPKFQDHRKTIEEDGKVVMVDLDEEKPQDCIDWVSFKAAIDDRKAKVEKEYEDGKCEKKRRDYLIELMDSYWRPLCSGSDEDGNPIPSEYAKQEVIKAYKDIKDAEHAAKDPPEDYHRQYKKGKWDDICKKTD